MLKKIKKFNCNKVHTSIYDHPNYKEHKKLLTKNGFKLVQTNREYSCDIRKVDTKKYYPLIKKLEAKGIRFYDSKEEMRNFHDKFPEHYKKLEKLIWIYAQDMPIPDGIKHTRMPFDQFMKYSLDFEENHYGVEMIAALGDRYIASTDIIVYPKAEPHKGWTGGLGVLKEFRRKGIATALKIKAFEKLRKKCGESNRIPNLDDVLQSKTKQRHKIKLDIDNDNRIVPEPACNH